MEEMDGLDLEEGVPTEGSRFAVTGSGEIDFNYVPQLLLTPSPSDQAIQCILVSPVEDRFLAVLPHRTWNRQVSKRILPSQF